MITIFHYSNCSTCVRARKWLTAHDLEHRDQDLVKTPPTAEQLRSLWTRSGLPLKKFFNTAGQSYRSGGWKDRYAALSDDERLDALAADGKLIKRPILDAGDTVLVGFKDAAWQESLG